MGGREILPQRRIFEIGILTTYTSKVNERDMEL